MYMSWFAEMFFEILATCVNHVSAYFTGIFLTQTVKFVQPKGNGFAVPAKRKFERVVNKVVCLTGIFVVVFEFEGGVESFVLELL